jgi:hypothetical protein
MTDVVTCVKPSAKACLTPEVYQQAAFWLPVCPVHLIADRDTLVLVPVEALELSLSQAQELGDAFNQHFADDGYRLVVVSELCWFLGSSHEWKTQFPSLAQAISMNLRDAWQNGKDAGVWRKLLNETQMLWFVHAVNQNLEGQGKLTINAFWSLAKTKSWWQFWR